MRKLLVGLIAVFVYPLLWIATAGDRIAKLLRIDTFLVLAAALVLPLWVITLVEFTGRDPGAEISAVDIVYLVLGVLFMGYVFVLAILGVLTRVTQGGESGEGEPGKNHEGRGDGGP